MARTFEAADDDGRYGVKKSAKRRAQTDGTRRLQNVVKSVNQNWVRNASRWRLRTLIRDRRRQEEAGTETLKASDLVLLGRAIKVRNVRRRVSLCI